MVPLFLLWAHLKTEQAPGTSNAVGVLTGIAGTIGYIINGWNVPDLPGGAWGYVMPAVGFAINDWKPLPEGHWEVYSIKNWV